MYSKRIVYVTPRSLEESALDATAAVIEALGNNTVRRGPDGKIELDDRRRLIVTTYNPNYLCFAIEQQGYALSTESSAGFVTEGLDDDSG